MNSDYFVFHLTESKVRLLAWQELLEYLKTYINWDGKRVLDVGCGRGELLTCLAMSADVTGIDPFPNKILLERGIKIVEGSIVESEKLVPPFDFIFASNLLEHLEMTEVEVALSNFNKILTDGGYLIILQPNFRYAFRNYFDDYTHKTIFTDKSLSRLLESSGFSVIELWPKILPYSVESLTFKIPHKLLRIILKLYLKSPVKPRAGQMLLIATKK